MPLIARVLPASVLFGCLMFSAASAVEPGVEEPIGKMPVQPFGPALVPANPAYGERVDDPAASGEEGPSLATPPGDAKPAEKPSEKPASPAPDKKSPAEKPKTGDGPAEKPKTSAGEPESKDTTGEKPKAEEPPKRTLTSAQTALRDRVRRILAYYHAQPLSVQENNVSEVLHACLPFGCQTELFRAGGSGQKINGITCLCWNYPCAGRQPLLISGGHFAARLGYGFQEAPGQLLATFALGRVPEDYPVRIDQDTRTVADLVESEKLSCRSGTDLSQKLVGLAYYADEPTWKNDAGEEWSIERMIQDELGRSIAGAAEGGTVRLLGLSFAVDRRAKRKQPIDGGFERAQKYVADMQRYALERQNADGSWGPYFFAAKAASRDPAVRLRSSGRVLQWLACSLPEEQLDDARVVRAVGCLADLLGGSQASWNVRALSTRDLASVMHGLHALAVYDQRVFKPCDPEKPAPGSAPAARTAASAER